RQLVDNDEKWRGILRGLNATFWHQTVTGAQIQAYITSHAGIDLSKVFQQYLTTPNIPVLEYKVAGTTLSYHWANVVPGFAMPVRAGVGDTSTFTLLHPTAAWKVLPKPASQSDSLRVDRNFLVIAQPAVP
ncbi:MAG TPA: hypothetical protein VF785_13755, partial [Gemmatimonadaceae bacterium]